MFRSVIEKESAIAEIKTIYKNIKGTVNGRLNEFILRREKMNENDIFKELVFCLLTPQSKATTCWNKVCELFEGESIFKANKFELAEKLHPIRFKNHKAEYITNARTKFIESGNIVEIINSFSDTYKMRYWFVRNVKGFGYKEASHFLRNIGFGSNIAILDRHILKNLNLLDIIDNYPKTLSESDYLWIESKMKNYAKYINIPINYLDFVLWYKQTNMVFK